MKSECFVDQIRKFLEWPYDAVEKGKARMSALFDEQGPDYLPLIFTVEIPELTTFVTFDRKELFYDPDKMACEQLWFAAVHLRSGSDAQPVIRVNTGCGTVPSILGLTQQIFTDAMPWLQEHLTKEEIIRFEIPEDISQLGLMPHTKHVIEFYREHLPGMPIYVNDTQGPMDIAHLIRGDEIFYDPYDDPEFTDHLMNLSVEAYIKVTEYIKSLTGEPHSTGYHQPFYMAKGGVRVCEDTSTLFSPDLIDRFIIPYTKRVCDHFGGAFIHYCGKNDYFLEAILANVPSCKYINLGNPEKHDIVDVIRRIKKAGKVYFGMASRPEGQSLEAYFRTILGALDGERSGLIFQPVLTPEERSEPARIMDLYHKIQDELLD